MIGRLVLSDRNIYKIRNETNSLNINARKCYILSEYSKNSILIKTSKEFNSKDEYIKFDPQTNTIIENLGKITNKQDDLSIYKELFCLNWLSNSKYLKLYNEILSDNNYFEGCNYYEFDCEDKNRIDYVDEVFTIDPENSIDLDDGFSFSDDLEHYYIDIHIADPVSWFNLENKKIIELLEELFKRQQTCYIYSEDINKINKPTHLVPQQIINIISLLKINEDSIVKKRRAISFCFKIPKSLEFDENAYDIDNIDFKLKFTNLTNIVNYSYEKYDNMLKEQFELKSKLVSLSNILLKIIGLKFELFSLEQEISHKMIEVFMIMTNWYGTNYLIKNINDKDKDRIILRTQDSNDFDINIETIPNYVYKVLFKSANYSLFDKNDIKKNYHYTLGIYNYSHLSSPMRRFVDMINHIAMHNINNKNHTQLSNSFYDIEKINFVTKKQKKISNSFDLLNFISKNPLLNKFKACLLDWEIINDTKTMGTLVLFQEEKNFIKIINVELPYIEQTNKLYKFMEFNIELYYNSNNFKTNKFPFSIKII
jgi:exoribonuclease R